MVGWWVAWLLNCFDVVPKDPSFLPRRLKADIADIHGFLTSMKDRRGFDAMRDSQAKQLVTRIAAVNSLAILASISESLHGSNTWTQDQLDSFDAAAVTAADPSQAPATGPDKKMQVVKHFAAYLSLQDLRELQSPQVPILAKVDVLAQRCASRLHGENLQQQ